MDNAAAGHESVAIVSKICFRSSLLGAPRTVVKHSFVDHAGTAEPTEGPTPRRPLPPLLVRDHRDRRVTVVLDTLSATVGELGDALGVPRAHDVVIDGRAVSRRVRVVRSGVRRGSTVGGRATRRGFGRGCAAAEADPTAECTVVVTVEAGPAVVAPIAVGRGRHVVGRARSAPIRLDDDAVELHHGVVDVDGAGHHTFVQLTGRQPCRIDTPAHGGPEDDASDGAIVVAVGASRLRIGRLAPESERAGLSVDDRPADPWRRTVRRPPRPRPVWNPVPVDRPSAESASAGRAGAGLLTSLLSLVGGVVIAVVMRNPMFLVFSGVGLLVSLGGRLGGGVTDRRRRLQERRTRAAQCAALVVALGAQRRQREEFHLAVARPVTDALSAIDDLTADVWSRRAGQPDAFVTTLGRGRVVWEPVLADSSPAPTGRGRLDVDDPVTAAVAQVRALDDEPVPHDLAPGSVLGVTGSHGPALTRSLVVQLAVWTGPADWRLVVVTRRPDDWAWCRDLPHAAGGPSGVGVIAAGDDERIATEIAGVDGDDRHVLVVTDGTESLTAGSGAVRRALARTTAPPVAVVAVIPPGQAVPAACTSLVEVGSQCVARWCPHTGAPTDCESVHIAGITVDTAQAVARRLAPLHDPEDALDAASATPPVVALSAALRATIGIDVDDAIAIAARWKRPTGDTGRPVATLGVSADGAVEVDLVRDGPHALVAGTTGAGKSELLRSFVVSIAARSSPVDVVFVLVDYKGGSTFDACASLPHTVGVVTDLDDRLAARALVSLEAELRRREEMLRAAGASDLDDYRESVTDAPPLPRLVVVIDEFAALASELPEFLSSLVGVAQRGRSLGVHLVLATQRPAGVVNDEIRANTNLRVALRLQDGADAHDIVGDRAPASFGRDLPGRAMLRLGHDETTVFQTALGSVRHLAASSGVRVIDAAADTNGVGPLGAGGEGAAVPTSELVVLSRAIRTAASLCEIQPPRRPWIEPLPGCIAPDDLAAALAVGSLDQAPDVAPVSSGVVGVIDDPARQCRRPLQWPRADGNLLLIGALGSGTTTAMRSVIASIGDGAHVFVIDGRGDGGLADLTGATGVAAVVALHDVERRGRVIRHCVDELEQRQGTGRDVGRPDIVLAIDGLPGLVSVVSEGADGAEYEALTRVLADGPALGLTVLATTERASGLRSAVSAHFAQRWVFRLDDAREGMNVGVPAALVPTGPAGRLVVAGSRVEAQVALLDPSIAPVASAAASVNVLPAVVDPGDLPRSSTSGGTASLGLGLDFASLQPAALDVPAGEHVTVLGPARSGRSNALVQLASAWRDAHPHGVVVVRTPGASTPVRWWAVGTDGVILADDDDALVAAVDDPADGPRLVVVDDADRVDDPAGRLLALVTTHRPELTLMISGRPDVLRTMYGHWTAVVRRSRVALLMTAGRDTDGDLVGEVLPRRVPIRPRPGLAWVVDAAGVRLVQLAWVGQVAGAG